MMKVVPKKGLKFPEANFSVALKACRKKRGDNQQ